MSKNVVETEWPQKTSQYSAYALRAGLARLYARMRMHTPTPLGTHMHARTRKHVHTGQYVILIAFSQQQWFRERASVLRYTYFACYVIPYQMLACQMKEVEMTGAFAGREGMRTPYKITLNKP
jgi:hypothetical protein